MLTSWLPTTWPPVATPNSLHPRCKPFIQFSLALILSLLTVLQLGPAPARATSLPPASAPAASTAPASATQIYRDLERLYQQALEATNRGDLEQAEALWSDAIARYPSNPASWSNRGNARVSQFKLTEAIADFDEAIALAPNEPDPYINRGTAWEGLQQWDKAIADYNQALALNPDDPVALNNRGNATGSKGDWETARNDFYRAAQLAPGFALANLNLVMTRFQLGETADALRQMRSLAIRYPNAADPRAALTAMLWSRGLKGEAESNWVAVMGLDRRYQDLDWVAKIRRWPPAMVEALGNFLAIA